MSRHEERYIPPLRYHRLTRFYDPIVRLTTRESTFRRALLQQVAPRPHDQVLDLGCGTATVTIALAKIYPLAAVTGLDADLAALAIARDKMQRAGVNVTFEHGLAAALPFPDGSFDRVVSSLFFHHLKRGDKMAALQEVCRVLRSGGELHVADWGAPRNLLLRGAFLLVQLLYGFENTRDNVRGLLPKLIERSGFEQVRETCRFAAPLGAIALLHAVKP